MTISSTNSPPRADIAYQPALVAELIDEHRSMARHLAQVLTSFEDDDLSTTGRLLDQFGHETTAHVYKETTKLYLYLQYALSDRPDEFAQMRKFRKEMDRIVADTMDFLERYKTLETDPGKQSSFKTEMEGLRDRWLARVKTEESILFPMYRPPAGT